MKFGLKNHIISLIHGVFSKYPAVKSVYIYGSRAKGSFKKTSDIDLILIVDTKQTISMGSLSADLDDLPIIYEIDLTDEATLVEGNFKEEYERTKQLFFEREG